MLSYFAYAFNAVAPILLMIVFGYYLKEKGVFAPSFFRYMNRFAFHYAFPCLMFQNMYGLGSLGEIDFRLAGFILASVALLTVSAFFISAVVSSERNQRGVLMQAGYRSNFAIIGLPLAEGIAGSTGLAVATAMQAPTILYFNIVSVLLLSIYSDAQEISWKKIGKGLVKNPLLQGITMGLIALLLREWMPAGGDGMPVFTLKGDLPWLYTAIQYLARVATPLCLVALGGQFEFKDTQKAGKELVTAVVMRLFLAPAIGFTLAFQAQRMGIITLTPGVIATLIAAFGSPIAVSSAVMAQEMGGDEKLAGQIVVWTSLFSMITIFAMIVLFRMKGMI